MRAVDLHTHSTRSDGTYTPQQLMDYAVEKELKAIALTDHDTTDGIDEALSHIQTHDLPLELVPGIEFSTSYYMEEEGRDQEVHVVGLFIDHHEARFAARVQGFVEDRIARNHKMCARLTEAGMPVTYEQLHAEFPDAVITRAHYGRFLLQHGYVKSIKEAFDRYIGEGGPCFVPREKITPFEVVHVIREAHGVPVLAHPMLYDLTKDALCDLIRRMKDEGLVGIEAIYSTHTPEQERFVRRIAKEYELQISGGSDFHGAHKPGLDLRTGYGSLFVPEEILENLRTCAK